MLATAISRISGVFCPSGDSSTSLYWQNRPTGHRNWTGSVDFDEFGPLENVGSFTSFTRASAARRRQNLAAAGNVGVDLELAPLGGLAGVDHAL